MGLLRRIRGYLAAEKARARRGAPFWADVYRPGRSIWWGLPEAHARSHDADWRVVVDWAPVPEALAAYARWKLRHHLTDDGLKDCVRRELRGGQGGEMRVLASPDLVASRPRA